jgi:hypothetical protein
MPSCVMGMADSKVIVYNLRRVTGFKRVLHFAGICQRINVRAARPEGERKGASQFWR